MSRAAESGLGSMTVRVPLRIRKRGGRKLVNVPNGSRERRLQPNRFDAALVKAVVKAFRWRRLLETGVHATFDEIAAAEKVSPSYVNGVLRLILLTPEIVEAILDSYQPPEMTLGTLMKPICVGIKGAAEERLPN